MKNMYCLVVTDDYSRFSWVFFLATKDETSGILKAFITGIENLIDDKVKIIRCNNRTEFKNKEMNQFCESIRREFSVARTLQQNGVAERKNKTLIEAARTMLADSKLPTTFWAEAVNTACYIQNRVLVVKPHNKTPYELFLGRKPALSFMRPFGCPVTILNTLDYLGPKSSEDEVADVARNKSTEVPRKENEVQDPTKECDKNNQKDVRDQEEVPRKQFEQEPERLFGQGKVANTNSTNILSTVSSPVNAVSSSFTTVDPGRERTQRNEFENLLTNPLIPDLEDIADTGIFSGAYDEVEGAVADFNNLELATVVKENQSQGLSELLTCFFLSQIEPKKVIQALTDLSWIEIMQDKLLQFRLQKVWRLVDLPIGKHAIGTKWVYRNKKDERGIVVRNKARLVAQGYTQEEGIDYDEVFAHVARIKAIRFLAYASFMGFIMYQIDVKSAFLYSTIEEEDEEVVDVDIHLYGLMIGSFMYLTASRPDIMFAVCACARFQVTPKVSHLHAVKRIFRYLKGQPKLGLWYPGDSPFDLKAFLDSDYAGVSLDRKSTIGGCQFLGKRLISWQCKKQTVVANSTTKEKYVAAANCYGHVLWI
uniref:Ribonuclease H-like domain-containing protein n=1 Tax=Tanacetum cinerariifolium TaxID=118510 RepID=A0A6L2N689_TANCI|nr:ribonuclease H-like domain-containing protein [Tanacetum cinerariifolium]